MGMIKSVLVTLLMGLSISGAQAGEKCRHLKPVHELKDLLQQLHANLDSNCILQMSDAELEQVWQLPIIDSRIENRQLLELIEALSKPYVGGASNFVVAQRSRNNPNESLLSIYITHDFRQKKLSLFPDGRIPNYLPNPNIAYVPPDYADYYDNSENDYSNFLGKEHRNDFFKVMTVYWESPKARQKNLPRMSMDVNSDATVYGIDYFRNYVDKDRTQ